MHNFFCDNNCFIQFFRRKKPVVIQEEAVLTYKEAVVPHREAHFASKGVFLPRKKTYAPILPFCASQNMLCLAPAVPRSHTL